MRRFYIIFMLTIVLSFFTSNSVFAEGYDVKLVDIPISFNNNTGSVYNCTVFVKAIDDAPAPKESSLSVKNGMTARVEIELSAPGVYEYGVHRQKGDDVNILYDERAYRVIFYISENSEKELESRVTVEIENGGKAESVTFTDRKVANKGSGKGAGGAKYLIDPKNGNIPSSDVDQEYDVREGETSKQNDGVEEGEMTEITTAENIDGEDSEKESYTEEEYTERETDIGEENSIKPTEKASETAEDKAEEQKKEVSVQTGDNNRQDILILVMIFSVVLYVASFIAEKIKGNSKKR